MGSTLARFGVFLPLGHLFKCHGAALAYLNGQAVVGSEALPVGIYKIFSNAEDTQPWWKPQLSDLKAFYG